MKVGFAEARTRDPQDKSLTLTTTPRRQLMVKVWKAHYKPLNTRVLEKLSLPSLLDSDL